MKSKWQTKELSKVYLDNIRGAIPSATTQLEVLIKVVRFWNSKIKKVMDLGCGDGILGRTIKTEFPDVQIYFVDFSDPMLEAAKSKIKADKSIQFIKSDFSSSNWEKELNEKFDLVISGFSIHHQPDTRKKKLYKEIFELLNPNGIFLNLEHVASATGEVEKIFDDYFIDHLFDFHHNKDLSTKRDVVANKFYNRKDKEENILVPVELQCKWLRDIGYRDVDCFFKVFELALFGGRKIV